MGDEKFQKLALEQFDKINQQFTKVFEELEELKTLKTGQYRLESKFASLENHMESVEKGQQRLETRMENEVIDKIRALFDDSSVNQEYFASIRDSQSRIEKKLDTLFNRAIDQDRNRTVYLQG